MDLSATDLSNIKKGIKLADTKLTVADAGIHAMRNVEYGMELGINITRSYFEERINEWQDSGDMIALGEALHPIMDAYVLDHRFGIWKDQHSSGGHISHITDYNALIPSEVERVGNVVKNIYSRLQLNGQTYYEPYIIFNDWAFEFKREYSLLKNDK